MSCFYSFIEELHSWSLIFCFIPSKADPSSVDQKKRPAVGKQEVGTQIAYRIIGFEINYNHPVYVFSC